jgi:hypothetical protein
MQKMQSHLFILSHKYWDNWILFRKLFPMTICSSVFPTTSCSSFKVSGIILRSLILWFTWSWYWCRVRDRNLVSVFYMLIQFSIFVEKTDFCPSCVLGSIVKDQLAVAVWVYVSVFYSNPLVFISAFVSILCCFYCCSSVVQFEVGIVIPPALDILLRTALAMQDHLCFYDSS